VEHDATREGHDEEQVVGYFSDKRKKGDNWGKEVTKDR